MNRAERRRAAKRLIRKGQTGEQIRARRTQVSKALLEKQAEKSEDEDDLR